MKWKFIVGINKGGATCARVNCRLTYMSLDNLIYTGKEMDSKVKLNPKNCRLLTINFKLPFNHLKQYYNY